MKEPVTTISGRLGLVMKRMIRPMLFCLVAGLPHWLSAQTAPATIIIDNADAVFTGNWTTAFSSPDRYDKDYKFSSTATGSEPSATATYTPTIKTAGKYSVDIWYPQGQNRATNAPWIIAYDG